jgi:hypothetical protein
MEMSSTNEWTDYHLTQRGWEKGTEKLDFVGETQIPVPIDTVLTLRFHEHQSCSFADEERWYEEICRSPGDLDALLKKFGSIPNRYRQGRYTKRTK